MQTLDELQAEILKEFPSFKVISKADSSLMKLINGFLMVITFGQMKLFMTHFVTTLGTTVYTPSVWNTWPTPSKLGVLRHERVHMRQAKKYGRLLYSFLYLFVPLPGFLAYFRMKFEREAYTESIKASAEYYGLQAVQDPKAKEAILNHFTTAEYFWMWPFRSGLSKWYDDTVKSLQK